MQLVGNIYTIYNLASIASEYVPGPGSVRVSVYLTRAPTWRSFPCLIVVNGGSPKISFFSTFENKVAVVEKDLPVSSGKSRKDLKDNLESFVSEGNVCHPPNGGRLKCQADAIMCTSAVCY